MPVYFHARKLIAMHTQYYYSYTGSSPLEKCKVNVDFFKSFVKNFGSCSANEDLWPGENLRALIRDMKAEQKSLVHKEDRKMASKLIRQYKNMYQTLINQ